MSRSKFIHEIIKGILDSTVYTVSFASATDNGDGTFTLNGICDLHHAQPGFTITIGSANYVIVSYDLSAATLTIKGTTAISVLSFTLYKPLFVHGTPMQQEVELTGAPQDVKNLLVYLMEPYNTEYDYTVGSAIDRRIDITLCFLTQAKIHDWQTDDFYYNALRPMTNLMEDVLRQFESSFLFNTIKQKGSPVYYTRFGINIRSSGTKKLYMSEKLSGVSVDLHLEVYNQDDCNCPDGLSVLQSDPGNFLIID